MSAPRIVDDGNLSVEAQNGSWVITNPLSDKGNYTHIRADRKVRVTVGYFNSANRTSLATQNITVHGGTRLCYLIGTSEAENVGNNLIEWTESYADIPASRPEETSITYTQQFLASTNPGDGTDVTYSIVEFTSKRSATIMHDYYLNTNPLPVIGAPRLETILNRIYAFYGWTDFNTGDVVVAEDSTKERYLGDIYVRKTTYITWIKPLPITPISPTI